MTRRQTWARLSEPERREALRRSAPLVAGEVREKVVAILRDVRERGDAALRDFARRFDGVALDALEVSRQEIAQAGQAVTRPRQQALDRAIENVRLFHRAQLGAREVDCEPMPGIRCRSVVRPIERVGLYAPGGTAPLASTVYMLAVPAELAGCRQRVLCTPPRRDGTIDPHVLVAAQRSGVERIFKLGGAQAIAAMAYGTETVPKNDKVFGPGNVWVTVAKQLVNEDPDGAAIDMPAGPSEVLVIADGTADPRFVASDLLSQAEHAVDAHVLLLSPEPALLDAVEREIAVQLATLPRREIAAASLAHARLIETESVKQAVEVANRYAPEHLILQIADAAAWVERVRNAGAVFVGPWSPESAGDYASGGNHVLPTHGFARAWSGLSLSAFEKTMTVQELSRNGLAAIGPTIEALAELEGLEAHRRAVTIRCATRNEAPPMEAAGTDSLARTAVRELVAYASARSHGTAKVLLDANESPWSGAEAFGPLHRYPEPQPHALVATLAELYDVSPDRLCVLRGTDDVIDGLLRIYCEAGRDAILICPPTYGVYSVAARLQGAAVTEVPLRAADGFALDVEAVRAAWTPRHKVVFVCSPNNPTGNSISLAAIEQLADSLRGRALVVVDEAYVEFSSMPSAVGLLDRYDNVVVLRTLSKAFALAGARCGVGIAHPSTIALLQKVRAPYPLSRPAVDAVLAALGEQGEAGTARLREHVQIERARLSRALVDVANVVRVFPSDANFLLVEMRSATRAVSACRAAGILIRDRSTELGLQNCVRITIGTREENDLLLRTLMEAA